MLALQKVYRGAKTRELSFPLGGIGTGCVGLAGNGRLIDWEIRNRPAKGTLNGFSHFAVKAEDASGLIDARVLEGDLQPPYTGEQGNFGFGPRRENLAGLPHFKDCVFHGEFPVARLDFKDARFPGRVALTAFNPFIPLDDRSSSIPAAFFEIVFTNETERPVTYTAAFTVQNPFPAGKCLDRAVTAGGFEEMALECADVLSPGDVGFGSVCFATDARDVSRQQYWYRGGWFDNLGIYWRDFASAGPLKDRVYHDAKANAPDHATLAARVTAAPGEEGRVRFVLSWSFPNCENYWNPEKTGCGCGDGCRCEKPAPKTWKNYYATVYRDARQSAEYALRQYDRLYRDTLLFQKTLWSSTLPAPALEAVCDNLAILKSPTCLRLEDGSFYGWEGCSCGAGCCEGSCTHVWNYNYALPFLFPALERSMHDLDYTYNQREDGGMAFRLQLPLGRERSGFRPCVDGQFGVILKAYQYWKYSGDTSWLRGRFPAICKAIEFAWSPSNEDRWDRNKDGVLEGRQHHTLDMELFGPSSWLNGMYLAALKAGAEMAEALGEPQKAEEYRGIFASGKAWVDKNLFNGEYYFQKIDLREKQLLEKYDGAPAMTGGSASETYWNDEAGEIKYQIGEGCALDQVLAQWHARLSGLGDVFDPDQVRSALGAVYRNNFKNPMRDSYNPCRIYSLNDEAGLVICDWPQGRYKPVVPVPYAEETMNGFEYQAACHMIMEGMEAQGLECVRAVVDRYDGEKRNPWNEFECGSNYARSMASYALLPACSGFSYDMTRGRIGFAPRFWKGGVYRCFWSLASGWGEFRTDGQKAEIRVLRGELRLSGFSLPFLKKIGEIRVGGVKQRFGAEEDGVVTLESAVTVAAGKSVVIRA